MMHFSQLRQEQSGLGGVHTCFLAMAQPSLAEGLAAAAASPCSRIIVQPHLLFYGDLLERLRAETAAAAALHPGKQWIVANHLGPHPLLVQALLDRTSRSLADRGDNL